MHTHQIWPEGQDQADQSIPDMSMEDREARRIGINIGDRISYAVAGKTLEFNIAAIHRQKGVQTRFWFEGIVADGALGTSIERYVGPAWLNDGQDVLAQKRIAAGARELLGQASQVYEASVLNVLGARLSVIRKSLYLEFLLLIWFGWGC
ncbi:hypothetical protein [Leucothrix pacifica]|uniref:hypothetical protein n=1 Tax=Leucothrix pacifica TaxID=1247513 RepID=UPI001C63FB48|nr:hypothetical protein [Leucothrix pacifica]